MAKKPVALEQFLSGEFPVYGLDLSGVIGEQRPLTTRTGLNVRTYDVLEMRARGGSRAGLSKYIPERVSGDHRIDHLNMIVDPTPLALPGTQQDIPDDDAVDDPSTDNMSQRVEPDGGGRKRVRRGGSGYSVKFAKLVLTITANNQMKVNGDTFVFVNTEFTTSGLEILDSVSTVELQSTGSVATAPAGTYAISGIRDTKGKLKLTGHAAFYKAIDEKYYINFQNGVMTIPAPGTWVFQSLAGVWDLGPWNFLDEQSTKSAQLWDGIDNHRYREVETSASITGPSGSWNATAAFRDFPYNFFNVNFAPNGDTGGEEPGPIDGIGHVPSIGELYTSTLTLTCAGTFSNFAGTYTYDCGIVTWTAVWKFTAS